MSEPEERNTVREPPPSLVPPSDSARPPATMNPASRPPALGLLGTGEHDASPASRRRAPRSLPPMPGVDPLLELAVKAQEEERWDASLDAYKKVLLLVTSGAGVEASIYASIGEVKRAQGKSREAESNFEKALAIDPKHARSLEGLVAIATEAGEWDRVAIARRRRAEGLDDLDEKAAELRAVAAIERDRLGRAEEALATLEIASVHRPDDVTILLELRDAYTHARAWSKLLGVLDELVRLSSGPRDRGAYRFLQADVALGRLREEPRGLAFLEIALDEDPRCDRALSALVAVRSRREEWAELAAVYERLIDRYAGLGDRDRAFECCRKLGVLRRDRLLDGPGALEALSAALELRPDDAETRASLAELYANKGDRTAAVRELETVARHAPLRAQTYRRLFALHQRAQRTDRAWLVATCLEELGASDVAQDLMVEQYRSDGPIRPTTGVDEAWWGELLSADGADPVLDDLLLTVGDAAVALRLEELEGTKRRVELDPAKRHDKTSTVSAVRTFVWAARALGVVLPELYVLERVPSGIAAVPGARPAIALGPEVLSGRTVEELAFLAGRHLTYYRAAHWPLVAFPTVAELSSLLLAAVRLIIPAVVVPARPGGDGRVEAALGERLSAEQRQRLEAIVARLDARGGRFDPLGWIRSVELTATRAGLLLAGDLRTAMRALKAEERAIGDLSFDAKRGDLLAFAASERYGQLRARMGAAIAVGVGAPPG